MDSPAARHPVEQDTGRGDVCLSCSINTGCRTCLERRRWGWWRVRGGGDGTVGDGADGVFGEIFDKSGVRAERHTAVWFVGLLKGRREELSDDDDARGRCDVVARSRGPRRDAKTDVESRHSSPRARRQRGAASFASSRDPPSRIVENRRSRVDLRRPLWTPVSPRVNATRSSPSRLRSRDDAATALCSWNDAATRAPGGRGVSAVTCSRARTRRRRRELMDAFLVRRRRGCE